MMTHFLHFGNHRGGGHFCTLCRAENSYSLPAALTTGTAGRTAPAACRPGFIPGVRSLAARPAANDQGTRGD